jgi:hypothetical protein
MVLPPWPGPGEVEFILPPRHSAGEVELDICGFQPFVPLWLRPGDVELMQPPRHRSGEVEQVLPAWHRHRPGEVEQVLPAWHRHRPGEIELMLPPWHRSGDAEMPLPPWSDPVMLSWKRVVGGHSMTPGWTRVGYIWGYGCWYHRGRGPVLLSCIDRFWLSLLCCGRKSIYISSLLNHRFRNLPRKACAARELVFSFLQRHTEEG